MFPQAFVVKYNLNHRQCIINNKTSDRESEASCI